MPKKKLTAATDVSKINIDPRFVERYKMILGDSYDTFFEYSMRPLKKAIRVNTLKTDIDSFKRSLPKEWEVEKVPWCDEGFWIRNAEEERFDIGNLLEHPLGYIYVQDPASMIPPVVLDAQPGEMVLDMCAAPGSKTTQIAQGMKNRGTVIANDNMPDRLKMLEMNVRRLGIQNVIITQSPGTNLRRLEKKGMYFDKVLLDAPCSGSGTIRKSYRTVTDYSYNFVKKMSQTQKRLILTAFDMLKVGGTLVYSTCTLEPEEDEEVITYLLNERDSARIESIDLPLKSSKPFYSFEGKEFHEDIGKSLRIYPQDNDTEGFFVAKITKK